MTDEKNAMRPTSSECGGATLETRVTELEVALADERQARREVEALVDALRKKVTTLDADGPTDAGTDADGTADSPKISGTDHYDQGVLDALDRRLEREGAAAISVSTPDLIETYKLHTALTQDGTIKGRVKTLVKQPWFTPVKPGIWRYTPEQYPSAEVPDGE